MNDIVDFCKKRLAGTAYKIAYFDALRRLAETPSVPRPTDPGKFPTIVKSSNFGETAFQRALFNRGSAVLEINGVEHEITWKDLELPVVFSTHGRRHCIDLIGSTAGMGLFLCELKYMREIAGGHRNLPDYAILQALLYQGIVVTGHFDLDEKNVCHRKGAGSKPNFSWKEISQSNTIMVLGNCNAWNSACRRENRERIRTFVSEIHESLGITVLTCCALDDSFPVRDNSHEWYEPKIILPAGVRSPRLKIVDFTA